MIIQSEQEYQGMKAASEAVAETLRKMIDFTRVGMTTLEIDQYGGELLASLGTDSAPFSEYNFPGFTCISLNDEACHGIPANRIIQEGDLLNIDVSGVKNGFFGDNGCSFVVGEDIHGHQKLVDASQSILMYAISQVKSGVRINHIGGIIHKEAKKRGFEVVRNICGHGIGYKLHEEPKEIACWKDRMNRQKFKKGMVVAIETFISTKAKYVHEQADGWTLKTKDGSFVAQHEHTLIVTNNGPEILTTKNGIQ